MYPRCFVSSFFCVCVCARALAHSLSCAPKSNNNNNYLQHRTTFIYALMHMYGDGGHGEESDDNDKR